jgi:hypothetical protein
VRVFNALVPIVAEYGRWDDLVEFVDNRVVVRTIRQQLSEDIETAQFSDGSVSLLGKWMPSINTSSKATVALAKRWVKALNMSEAVYRRGLSLLRKRINIVERLMSAGDFSAINYENVPSRAGMIYRKAFSKRDAARYVAYLESVKKGDKKINTATLYPYELVGKYLNGMREDETIELQWANLPNYADSDVNAIVMADVSGSMDGRPMEVSISLAIYFAERNQGAFHDYFMTFSGLPSLERVVGNTLYERVRNVGRANWSMNTNIQAAFDTILNTAKAKKVPASEMPRMLFIISDMEFDSPYIRGTNFDVIKRKYAAAGYELPTLVFWNVDSRNDQTPVTEREEGVFLVSGFSAGVFKAAINAKATNPMEMMLETLNDGRYALVDAVLDELV